MPVHANSILCAVALLLAGAATARQSQRLNDEYDSYHSTADAPRPGSFFDTQEEFEVATLKLNAATMCDYGERNDM